MVSASVITHFVLCQWENVPLSRGHYPADILYICGNVCDYVILVIRLVSGACSQVCFVIDYYSHLYSICM